MPYYSKRDAAMFGQYICHMQSTAQDQRIPGRAVQVEVGLSGSSVVSKSHKPVCIVKYT